MKCYKCEKKATVKSVDKKFCNACFCEIIEKRVRKEIRQRVLLKRFDKVLILDDKSEKSALNKYLLKAIINDPTIKFSVKKIKSFDINLDYSSKAFDKIAIPWTLEDETKEFLKTLFSGTKSCVLNKKIIKPLIVVSKNDAKNYAKIKKLSFEEKNYSDDVYKMIEKMDKKYPGTNFSILKTMRNLK